jgi:hypothetical protein
VVVIVIVIVIVLHASERTFAFQRNNGSVFEIGDQRRCVV